MDGQYRTAESTTTCDVAQIPPQILEGHGNIVTGVAFSPDGSLVASGSHDSTVRVWDVERKEALKMLKPDFGWVISVAFSLDGRWAAVGSDRGYVAIWEVGLWEMRSSVKGHGDCVGAGFARTYKRKPCPVGASASAAGAAVGTWLGLAGGNGRD